MKIKNTLILLVLAAGLLAFIHFYESKTLSTNEAADRSKRVFDTDTGAIDGILLTNNADTIDLRRQGYQWRMEAPLKDRADQVALNQLLTSIGSLEVDSSFAADGKGHEKVALKDLGLETSNVRMKLSGKNAPPEILFGKDAAVEGKMYVRLEGSDTVYIVGNDLKNQVQKKVGDFRDHRLLDMDARQVNKFSVKTPAGEIEMVKQADAWSIDKPLKARGDAKKIADLIAQTVNAHIDTFENESNVNASGLNEPRGSISLEAGGSTATVQIGLPLEKDKTRVYAKVSTRPSVYTMSNAIEAVMNIKPNDVRDRNLLELNLDTVDRIHIEAGGKPGITLARNQEDWTLKSSGDAPANTALVKKMVVELRTQQVVAFVSDEASGAAKYGLDNPALKVTFSAYASENTAESKAGENQLIAIAFGRVEGDVVYARLESEPYVVSVPKRILDAIPADPAQWRDLTIFKLKPDDVKSIEVVRDGQTTGIEQDKTGWKLVKGSGAVSQANAASLQNLLTTLHVVRWTGSSTAGLGFEKPSSVISFTTTSGKTCKLTLGNANPQNMWNAEIEGTPGAFLVSKPDYDILHSDLTDAARPAATASPATAPSTAPAGVK